MVWRGVAGLGGVSWVVLVGRCELGDVSWEVGFVVWCGTV